MKSDARQSAIDRHWHAGRQAAAAFDWPRAIDAFQSAVALAPQDGLLHLNLARALLRASRFQEATVAAQAARALEPGNALASRILAETLVHQNRHAEAAEAFSAMPADSPPDLDLLLAHGNALILARQPMAAVEVLFKAVSLKLDCALAHYRLGLAFKDLHRSQEASECFRTAAALDDGGVRALTLSLLVHESRQACDWSTLDADTQALLDMLDRADDRATELLSPFALLPIEATPAQQWRIGSLRTQGLTRGVQPLSPAIGPRRPGPVRVGYLSADFCRHATSVLMMEQLERRDRTRFEVFLYSHSLEDGSAIQHRIRAACDRYLDVTHLSHDAVAQRIREDGIDIMVDLKGHTRDSRFEILARRPAPVQVAYLGYPATTGADFIDYLIGDPVVTPLSHGDRYSECIAQMPNSYQPNDTQRPLPPAPDRATLGLPTDAVVLCCFNQTYKVSPAMVDLWAQILRQSPRAVLWMLAWNPHAQQRLRAELARRGVAASRLYFAPKLGLADHLARLRCADLFLDTWPCNAHTTASEALWAGVPVLTVPGETFASRVAASLASACGLQELVCADAPGYVQRATALANDPAALKPLQQRLSGQRHAHPLFDSSRHARDFEALLMRMFERQQAGLPPAPLAAVSSLRPGAETQRPALAAASGEAPLADLHTA